MRKAQEIANKEQKAIVAKALEVVTSNDFDLNTAPMRREQNIDEQMETKIPGWKTLDIDTQERIFNTYVQRLEAKFHKELTEESQAKLNLDRNNLYQHKRYKRKLAYGE